MTAVTGDFSLDFTGLADVNPYTNGDLTFFDDGSGDVRIISGKVTKGNYGRAGYYVTSAASSPRISKFEINISNTGGNTTGPCLINSTGNGIWFRAEGSAFRLIEITTFTTITDLNSSIAATFASGDQLTLEHDGVDTFTAKQNGTTIDTYVDATFTPADLRNGIYFNSYSAHGTAGALTFAADTYSSITVTQADTTPEDGVLQSFTTTGLTGTITAASLGGKDILSLLSNTDPTTATTYTLDVSATTTSIGQPRIGLTSTLSVTATGGTATTSVTIGAKTGLATVTLAGTLDKTASGFLHSLDADLGVVSAVGDIIYYSNARGEAITATGVYTGGTTIAYQSTAFVFQDVTGASATVTATSEGDAFYPFGETPGGGTGISGEAISSTDITGITIQSSTI